MRRLLLAVVAGLLAATAPLPAHADGAGYVGTCRWASVADQTPDGVLGGQTTWYGEVNVALVATTPGDTITAASCWFEINGTEHKVLDATVAGPVAAGAGATVVTIPVDYPVRMCTHVTTTLTGAHDDCQPFACAAARDNCASLVQLVLDLVTEQSKVLDQLVCPALVAAAPTIDSLPPGVLYVDPASGDTYRYDGSTTDNMIWDCPPYL